MSRTTKSRWVFGMVTLLALLCACKASPDVADGEGTSGGEGTIQFPDEEARLREEAEGPPASPEVERAERLMAANEVDEARELLRRITSEHPEDARAQLDLGLVLEASRDVAGAERAYRAALAARAEFPEALANLGVLLRAQDRLEEAIEQFREAVRLKPDFVDAHLNLALALEDGGDARGAEQSYRRVIRFDPQDALAHINLGLLLLELERTEEAVVELRRGLPHAQGNAGLLLAAGNGLRRAGQFEASVRAMRMALEARESGPTPAMLAELALAQRAADDRQGAEASLARALELDPRYATAHYLLGNMLAGRGAFSEAVEHYRSYLRLEPSGPHAAASRERMDRARSAARQ